MYMYVCVCIMLPSKTYIKEKTSITRKYPLFSGKNAFNNITRISILTTFEAPSISHSYSERKFVNLIITYVNGMWSDVKIVHRKLHHSQNSSSGISRTCQKRY